MLFCPTCNNILDISKNSLKNTKSGIILDETPDTISDSTVETVEKDIILDIINNILEDKEIDEKTIQLYKIENFTKHPEYLKLDKKQKSLVQTQLTLYYGKLDDSINAYYVCKNCTYSKSIDAGSLITIKTNTEDISGKYINYDKLKNKIYSKILPITKNYICINESCESHKNIKEREAVFYRIGNSVQIWYTCKSCKNYWKGE
jgi:hypothetical protein